jgi:hypothetical protein
MTPRLVGALGDGEGGLGGDGEGSGAIQRVRLAAACGNCCPRSLLLRPSYGTQSIDIHVIVGVGELRATDAVARLEDRDGSVVRTGWADRNAHSPDDRRAQKRGPDDSPHGTPQLHPRAEDSEPRCSCRAASPVDGPAFSITYSPI